MAGDENKADGNLADAAKSAGVPQKDILDFKLHDGRYTVVTVAGEKIKTTPAEREAAAKAANKAK